MKAFLSKVARAGGALWRRFRTFPWWAQGVSVILAVLVIGGVVHALSGSSTDTQAEVPTVTVSSLSALSGGETGVGVLGTVRSVTEANIVTEAGGTVRRVYVKIGQSVGAGAVLAELDNASQAAAVLQAEGAYDQAIAGRSATKLQGGNAQASLVEAQNSARDTFRSANATVENTLRNNVDAFYGGPTPVGPLLLISPLTSGDSLSRERRDMTTMTAQWDSELATVDSANPATLLDTAYARVQQVSVFLNDLSRIANDTGSGATAAQLASLATARSTINGLLSSLSAARTSYRAAVTAANVADTQTNSTDSATASADASVKSALGALRAAQAAYEKTRVRAPIAGTVNFFSLHVGDFVPMQTHVATVARNNALEVVASLPEDERDVVGVGDMVQIAEGGGKGVVTSVSPALDPNTKQIQVEIAVNDDSSLVDGQAVHITIPGLVQKHDTPKQATTTPAAQTTLLPLAAVKLRSSDRVVFTVGADSRLVAHPVTIGDVVGDKIQITSSLPTDLEIVTDARGLTEGEKVQIATSTNQTS